MKKIHIIPIAGALIGLLFVNYYNKNVDSEATRKLAMTQKTRLDTPLPTATVQATPTPSTVPTTKPILVDQTGQTYDPPKNYAWVPVYGYTWCDGQTFAIGDLPVVCWTHTTTTPHTTPPRQTREPEPFLHEF